MLGEIYALLAAFTWACALVLFKRGGEQLDPIGLNLFKNIIALTLLLVTLLLYGEITAPFSLLSTNELLLLCSSGILGIAIADSFLFASLQLIGVTRITIIDCLYSPSILFFSWLLLSESVGLIHLSGAALIISGILISTISRKKKPALRPTPKKELWLGILYGIIAVVCMAVGIVMVKPLLERMPLLWSTTVRLIAGAFSLVLWLLLRNPHVLRQMSKPTADWKFIIPGAVLGTYISMIFWVGGFKYAKASIAGLLNQSTIVFAIPLSVLFLRETFSIPKAIAVLFAAIGVLLIAFKPF